LNDSDAPIDNSVRVVTPENVAFNFRLAGPFRRFIAAILDFLCMALMFWLLFLLGRFLYFLVLPFFALDENLLIGIYFVTVFFVTWGYGGVLETLWNGQTLGKKATGIRVVSTDGLSINGQQAVLRNMLRTADVMYPFTCAIGFFSTALTPKFQRLGDLAADTMVVLEERRPMPTLPKGFRRSKALEEMIPSTFTADNRLAEALASYVARRYDFTDSRRRELASILAYPIIKTWDLPGDLDPDSLLCELYRREFL
jgi:uncharacterized RDD family membrane protein YckC